jgi:hypothetical protein
MNERIRELAIEAGMIVGEANGFDMTRLMPREVKFAELIIRECMKTCDETQAAYLKYRKESDDFQDKTMYHEGEAACYIVKYKLKKQFGVQE